MSVGAINSTGYANQILAYEQASKTEAAVVADTLEQGMNVDGDSVTVSDEARQAAAQKALSDRALEMLHTRSISDEDIDRFSEIIQNADKADDAKAFLKSLSPEDRDLVKRANSYGIPLTNAHIDSMTEEGARNMLVQPDPRSKVDLNNDGIVESGIAKTFVFPPPNAPESVKDAWDKTLEDMPESERLLSSSIFLTQQFNANLKFDASGKAIGFYEPGEEGYTNIFAGDESSWLSLLDDVDEYLDFSESVTNDTQQRENIDKNREIIDTFRNYIKS